MGTKNETCFLISLYGTITYKRRPHMHEGSHEFLPRVTPQLSLRTLKFPMDAKSVCGTERESEQLYVRAFFEKTCALPLVDEIDDRSV